MNILNKKTTVMTMPSRKKLWIAFFMVVVLGFLSYALPNIIFHVFKGLGGFRGFNLAWVGILQLIAIVFILYLALQYLGKSWGFIGVPKAPKLKHILLGVGVGLLWAVIQFAWLIPTTGGANRPDIADIIKAFGPSTAGVVGYAILGVLGGGVSEELFNRGFFINVLNGALGDSRLGYAIAVVFSVLFFAAGHLPNSALMWLDILIPTLAYTALFVATKKITASMFAHASYNLLAVLCTYFIYVA